ncbi:hypothetical protein [Roseovarius sp. D22-M7]|uniref:hypothetical protein n=1 Tax=Roseovarius sp. D22-M7 TaxID=3127116 RepID=UPI00300F9E30
MSQAEDRDLEYKVMPAPTRGRKAPGAKTPEARFALGLEDVLNEMARDGWQYLRSDILPSVERQGLTSHQTVYRSVLVFCRARRPRDPVVTDAHRTDPVAAPRVEGPRPPAPPE